MEPLIVYTCITQGKDELKENFQPEPGVKYICFSDGSVMPKKDIWDIRPLAFEHECPVKTARFHKIGAHAILPDHKWSIWMDGHLKPMVKQQDVIDWMGPNVMGVMHHQHRNCIYDEMLVLLDGFPIEQPVVAIRIDR